MTAGGLRVQFCDEWTTLDQGDRLTIGRDADLVVHAPLELHDALAAIAERIARVG